jgi:hypothetical protein
LTFDARMGSRAPLKKRRGWLMGQGVGHDCPNGTTASGSRADIQRWISDDGNRCVAAVDHVTEKGDRAESLGDHAAWFEVADAARLTRRVLDRLLTLERQARRR